MKRERTAHTLRSPKIPEALRFAVDRKSVV